MKKNTTLAGAAFAFAIGLALTGFSPASAQEPANTQGGMDHSGHDMPGMKMDKPGHDVMGMGLSTGTRTGMGPGRARISSKDEAATGKTGQGMGEMDMADHAGHTMGTDAPTGNYKKGLVIGRMKLTIMPEYDSPQALVIQEGKFADKAAFPAEARFILPMEVTKLTDVCSLSPGGHHFCQLFEIKKGADAKYMDVKLPYSDFFIDYQYAPFEARPNSERDFTFTVNTIYDINTLEVHIQKPYRSERFALTPAGGETYEKDGFEYYKYELSGVKAGAPKTFRVSYFKKDAQPSVDIKYSAMTSPAVFKGRTGEILLAAGVLALGAVWVIRRRMARSKRAEQ